MITVTDDMDVACYSLRWDGDQSIISPVSSVELEALPEFITDSINIGWIAEHNGLTYGISETLLTDEPMWNKT